ncbi:hypothetical protein HAX54_019949 [Datura stramonium]|uniref:Uncharacterized protein n=1 Tax=Datura stramonium TaxID=4076 RepID=A0ABS8URA1_DATST|nr:hypothetical protein [Datura stramonium]
MQTPDEKCPETGSTDLEQSRIIGTGQQINQRSKADIHQSQNVSLVPLVDTVQQVQNQGQQQAIFSGSLQQIHPIRSGQQLQQKCRTDQQLKQGSKVDLFQRASSLVQQRVCNLNTLGSRSFEADDYRQIISEDESEYDSEEEPKNT